MHDRSKAQALGRLKLLERALKTPAKAPTELMSACKSQGLLARMSCSDYDISPVALNSLKRAADSAIEDGGWSRLDALRREVHRLGSRGASSRARGAKGRRKD